MEGEKNEDLENRFKHIAKLEWLAAALLTVIFVIGSVFSFSDYMPARGKLALDNYGDFIKFEGFCGTAMGSMPNMNAYCKVYVRLSNPEYEINDFSAKVVVSASGGKETKTVTISGELTQDKSLQEECIIRVKVESLVHDKIKVDVAVQTIEGDFFHV